ncbi:uncharacterized protein LOC128211678 [Mya arenaria]|uniref:uncharacterized protein LOC128211678 n=1 Tax=Mya arenaria TaxID=6604 RepID=UPI0022E2F140|nr:uncharacterized protein LOC128211678 [Mya arenaria]
MQVYFFLDVCLILVAAVSCAPVKRSATFDHGVVRGHVTSHSITEASGLCASRQHHNVLYTHNDSGDTNRIFAISATTGQRLMTIYVDGASAHDWEDIACGPCTGGSGHCIYIADTGGNAGGDSNTIYRVHEPTQDLNNGNGGEMHTHVDSVLKFSWDQHDCETVMVDNKGEVYLVSKVGAGHHAKLVHLPSHAWGTNQREYVNEGVYLSVTSRSYNPVGGDISPDGTEVLLKAYGHVYYWHVPDRNYYSHMTSYPAELSYTPEQQGEAVAWEPSGAGFYTLSEGTNAALYYHRRTSTDIVG